MRHILFTIISTIMFTHLNGSFISEHIDPLPKRNEIPKILHQIWIGPKPLPEHYKRLIQTCKDAHPDWEHRLWTNEDIKDFPWKNKEAFDKSTNYGMRSDIWRYEILHLYGGLYLDTDIECFKSFNPLMEKLTFFASYLDDVPLVNKEHKHTLGCSIIGAIPRHPLISGIIDHINEVSKTHPFNNIWREDFKLTGPFMLEKQLPPIEYINPATGYCILPPSVTHPLHHTKAQKLNFNISKELIEEQFPDCISIEYHGASWYKRNSSENL